jgi:hypothetical protein
MSDDDFKVDWDFGVDWAKPTQLKPATLERLVNLPVKLPGKGLRLCMCIGCK